MSLACTKAIWGAAESFSNKITLSVCTLHGSDCRASRSPIPRLLLDLLLLLILAYMTDSNWKHHTPEVGAKSTVRLKKDHLLIKLNCTHWRQWAIQGMKRRGAKEKKTRKNKKKDKSVHSLCDPSRQKNKLHFCIMAPEGQNWHRVPSQPCSCVSMLIQVLSVPTREPAEMHRPTFQPFILASFVLLLHSCLLSLPSIGQNWLLLFQTALSLLMPQVSGRCTPWELGLEKAATNLPR